MKRPVFSFVAPRGVNPKTVSPEEAKAHTAVAMQIAQDLQEVYLAICAVPGSEELYKPNLREIGKRAPVAGVRVVEPDWFRNLYHEAQKAPPVAVVKT